MANIIAIGQSTLPSLEPSDYAPWGWTHFQDNGQLQVDPTSSDRAIRNISFQIPGEGNHVKIFGNNVYNNTNIISGSNNTNDFILDAYKNKDGTTTVVINAGFFNNNVFEYFLWRSIKTANDGYIANDFFGGPGFFTSYGNKTIRVSYFSIENNTISFQLRQYSLSLNPGILNANINLYAAFVTD